MRALGFGAAGAVGSVAVVVGLGVVMDAGVASATAGPGESVAEVVPGSGVATHYDSVDGGNCSLVGPPDDHLDVALSHVEYATADSCGGYLDVVGPQGSVRVLITNQCPECPLHHLDLSKTAFARIAPLEDGRVPVSYTLVRDPPVAQPIAVRVKTGSSRWWMQVQAIDHGNPIAAFELQTGTGWRSLVHTEDNFWMAENPGPGDGPYTVRITDIYGQSVTIDDVAMAPDQVQRTSARLYGPGSGSGSAPPPAPTPTAPPATEPPTTTTVSAAAAPTTSTTVASTQPATSAEPQREPGEQEAAVAPGGSDGGGVGTSTMLLAAGTFTLAAGAAYVLRRRGPGTPAAAGGEPRGQPPISAAQRAPSPAE